MMVNLDYMCLDNQSQYCLDVTEYLPELCNSQSLFEGLPSCIKLFLLILEACLKAASGSFATKDKTLEK